MMEESTLRVRGPVKEIPLFSNAVFHSPGSQTEQSLGYVQLFNPTASRIAFKVKTNAPKYYLVKPINGIIVPRGQETVQIAFRPPTDASEISDLSKHMFLLEAAIITNPAYNDVAKIVSLSGLARKRVSPLPNYYSFLRR